MLGKEKYRITDKDLCKIIEERYGFLVGTFHLLDKQQTTKILHELRSLEGVTILQLARVTGVSKFIVEKA